MFWLDDPITVLFRPASLTDILPVLGPAAAAEPMAEQLNRAMRFAAYFAVMLLLLGRASAAALALLLTAVFTYIVWSAESSREGLAQEACRRPTAHNPFMNPLVYDDPKQPGACDVADPQVRRESKRHFESNLYRDVSDVFHRVASDRQYYTVPVTTTPNDQTRFARWLYDAGPTCKEDPRRCRIRDFEDVRL